MLPSMRGGQLGAWVVVGVLLVACGADDPNALTGGRSGSSGSAASGSSSGDGDPPAEGSSTSSTSSSGATTSSSSSGNTSSSSSGGNTPSTFHALCVSKINAFRQTKGLPALTRWNETESCADGQSMSDAQTNTPHGAFPGCGEFAQNECPGIGGSTEQALDACLQLMWNEGPGGGHFDNMASTTWTKVACGLFVTAGGQMWSVQNFR